ncbi:MAG: YjjG family noncanonical pyrimidine nucleotidase [Muribaculaceae bacterium]
MAAIDLTGIEWVWVDLDDTLWDFSGNSLISLAKIYDMHDLHRFYQTMEQWRNRYLEVNHSLWARYNVGTISKDYLQHERFARPLIDCGMDEKEAYDYSEVLHTDYLRILGQCSTLVPGARTLLEHIKARGLKIGVLSNGFKEVQFDKLRSGGVLDMIDCIVLSDEIDINKPDRRIFDYALQKAGTTAEHSIMIGDNPDTDIKGALNAGWRAVFFNRNNLPIEFGKDVTTVNDLRDIIA